MWKNQILPAIIGSSREGFVTGEIKEPTKYLEQQRQSSSGSKEIVLKPDHALWRLLDQGLLGWMLSSISLVVQTQITKPSSSFQLWTSLGKLFENQYRAKLMQLKLQLQCTKKEWMSMSAYFSKMKGIAENLSMAGCPVFEDDFILHLFQGIPFEYDFIIASINSRSEALGLEDVQALLVSQDMRIQSANTEPNPSAHVADRQKNTD